MISHSTFVVVGEVVSGCVQVVNWIMSHLFCFSGLIVHLIGLVSITGVGNCVYISVATIFYIDY